jgi:hypothetical protein
VRSLLPYPSMLIRASTPCRPNKPRSKPSAKRSRASSPTSSTSLQPGLEAAPWPADDAVPLRTPAVQQPSQPLHLYGAHPYWYPTPGASWGMPFPPYVLSGLFGSRVEPEPSGRGRRGGGRPCVRMEERQHYEEECRRCEKEVGQQRHNSSLKAVHTTPPCFRHLGRLCMGDITPMQWRPKASCTKCKDW